MMEEIAIAKLFPAVEKLAIKILFENSYSKDHILSLMTDVCKVRICHFNVLFIIERRPMAHNVVMKNRSKKQVTEKALYEICGDTKTNQKQCSGLSVAKTIVLAPAIITVVKVGTIIQKVRQFYSDY